MKVGRSKYGENKKEKVENLRKVVGDHWQSVIKGDFGMVCIVEWHACLHTADSYELKGRVIILIHNSPLLFFFHPFFSTHFHIFNFNIVQSIYVRHVIILATSCRIEVLFLKYHCHWWALSDIYFVKYLNFLSTIVNI